MNATVARPGIEAASHYYFPDGTPAYTVPNKSKPGTDRPTTVADARRLGLLPSVTTILSILHKPALEAWKQEQLALAILTTPQEPGEALDAFVARVLPEAEEEARKAREFGSELHNGMEGLFKGAWVEPAVLPWILPAFKFIDEGFSASHYFPEYVIVGNGYAGKLDLIQSSQDGVMLWDFKTCKTLPDKPWPEHRLQLSAYAAALARYVTDRPIATANCYISSVDQGRFVIHKHESWQETYKNGFKPLVHFWRWANRMREALKP